MWLPANEVEPAIKQVEAAFPRFTDWQYVNQKDEDYSDFTLWGEWILDPEDDQPRSYFITFDTFNATWHGHLSIGQHVYFMSSADFGDAHLVDTEPCSTLEEAIDALKAEVRRLFTAIIPG